MHRARGRLLALLAFAAGTAAGVLAVLSALHAPVDGVEAAQATVAAHTESCGAAQVVVRKLPVGTTCYRVLATGGSAHACRARIRANDIGYTIAPRAIGGVAGKNVRAVIKVLRDGSRKRFTVTPSR